MDLNDSILVDLASLPSGAQFDLEYRLRVRDLVTPEFVGYSNEFIFKSEPMKLPVMCHRDTCKCMVVFTGDSIQIDIPVRADGEMPSERTVVLGLVTRFAFQFSEENIVLSQVSFVCTYPNGTVARDIGIVSGDKSETYVVPGIVPSVTGQFL